MARNYILEVADKNLDLAWSVIMSALDRLKDQREGDYWTESHQIASDYYKSEWFKYRNRLGDNSVAHYFRIDELQRTIMEFTSFVDRNFSLATSPFVDKKIVNKVIVNLAYIHQTIIVDFKVTADKSITL